MKQLALAAVLLAASAARATVLVPLDTKAMAERADRIVYATVESQQSRWSADHQIIYTDVTLRVVRVYKGALQPGDSLVVRREGGVVDGIGMRVFGAAAFWVSEEVVVFVETRGAASYTVGMTQGKLRVTTGADGIRRVAANLADVAFTGDALAAKASMQPRRLDDFERELGSLLRSAR